MRVSNKDPLMLHVFQYLCIAFHHTNLGFFVAKKMWLWFVLGMIFYPVSYAINRYIHVFRIKKLAPADVLIFLLTSITKCIALRKDDQHKLVAKCYITSCHQSITTNNCCAISALLLLVLSCNN